MIRATSITHTHQHADDTITLTYEQRFKRRIKMTSDKGLEFLLDLAKVTDLRENDHLVLEDGRHITILAAPEPLYKITAPDPHHLMRLIWHIGNRHLPASIHNDHILIQPDHVIKQMIAQLGGHVEELSAAFTPEGGAYGMGRTHAHEH